MNHIKSFDEINEKLSKDQRILLHLPLFLFGFISKQLIGLYPLLNFRWREIKKKTKDSHFDPIFSSSGHEAYKIEKDIRKVNKSDLPSSSLNISMFFRGWNIYLIDKEIDGRKVLYISKDELSKGDYYIGERLSERDIYSDDSNNYTDGKRIYSNYPVVILVAKFDNINKTNEIEEYIKDMSLDIEDNFGLETSVRVSYQNDKISVGFAVPEKMKIPFSDDLSNQLNQLSKRIIDYLKTEKITDSNQR